MTQPDEPDHPDQPDPNQRIRVLWLVKGLGPGGAEHLLLSAARVADHRRFRIDAAYLLSWKDALVPRLAEAGVPATCLGTGRAGTVLWPLALRRHLRAGGYDVVHVHSPLPAGVLRLVRLTLPRASRPAVVSTEHNEWGTFARPTRVLNALLYGGDRARFAVSERVRASVWRPWRRGVRTLVHGIVPADAEVPPGTRERVRAELGIGPDEVVVTTVANFRAQKAYPDLLQAASIVCGHRADVRFVAVGQGPLAEEVHQRRDDLGLGERFILTGFRPDAIAIVAASDVFVLASYVEGYPIAVMEALAAGVPVVATAVGGVPDAVRDGVEGLLVPPGRPEALADRIETVAGDPDLRQRMAAAARVRGRGFDIATTQRTVESAYVAARDSLRRRGRRRAAERPALETRG